MTRPNEDQSVAAPRPTGLFAGKDFAEGDWLNVIGHIGVAAEPLKKGQALTWDSRSGEVRVER